jgi:hypothetical protein
MGSIVGIGVAVQMDEDLLEDLGRFDAGDGAELAAAALGSVTNQPRLRLPRGASAVRRPAIA